MTRTPLALRSAVLAVALLIRGLAPGAAQEVTHRLGEPDAAYPWDFAVIQGVRELDDGRVLVADPLGQALVRIDLDAGTADTLGRVGQGPGEYRRPDGLFRLPGDSTLLIDLGNGRLTVIGPDGTFGETIPIAAGRPGEGTFSARLPRGTDRDGRVYFRAMGGMRSAGPPTEAPVLRWNRDTEQVDTIAMVALQEMKVERSGSAGQQSVRMEPVPLSPEDGWAVGWDGRLAVARAGEEPGEGYRLEWIEPDGRVLRGPEVAYRPVPIREDEKLEWADRADRSGGGVGVTVEVRNGVAQTTFSRGGTDRERLRELDRYEWPEVKPPFVPSEVRVSPDGRAWVLREAPADAPPVYDVFAPDGSLEARVQVPAERRLAAFGNGAVYLVRLDELGLQYLERYRLP